MVAAFVKVAASNQQTTASTSITATVAAGGVAVGHTLVVGVNGNGVGTVVSATDTRGNTYTIDRTSTATTGGQVVHATITTALLAGDTITVTGDTSISDRSIIAGEFSGVDDFDQVVSGSGTGTAVNSGATPATTQANELVVAFVGISSSTGTLTASDASYTQIGSAGVGLSRQTFMFYKTVAAVGTQAITATLSASVGWRGTVATYAATPAPVAPAFEPTVFDAAAFDAQPPITETGSGGGDATVTVTAVGEGTPRDRFTDGSSSTVTVTAVGEGAQADRMSGGSVATVATSPVGTGTGRETNTGGAVSTVTAVSAGAGTAAEGTPFADDFNRPDGPLGGNWIGGSTAPTITGGQVTGAAAVSIARWVTPVTGKQFSQATHVAGAQQDGVAVAMPGFAAGASQSASTMTWYAFRSLGLTAGHGITVKNPSSGTYTTLVSSSRNLVGGDVLRLEWDGTTLTGYVNGIPTLTHTPVTPLTGQHVGIVHVATAFNGVPILDNWSGGGIGGAAGGAATSVTTVATGAGTPRDVWSGGSTVTVTTTATGEGTQVEPQPTGGSVATVTTTAAGAGTSRETQTGGAAATVTTVPTGAGTPRERLTGGASTTVTVTPVGAGTPRERVTGGAVVTVASSPAGAGSARETATGGAKATVTAATAGAGTTRETGTGGGTVTVASSPVGGGTARERVSDGSTAIVHVTVTTPVPQDNYTGGGTVAVPVTPVGAGTARETATGGGGTSRVVTVTGAGSARETASGGAAATVTAGTTGAGTARESGTGAGFISVGSTPQGGGTAVESVTDGSDAVVYVVASGAGLEVLPFPRIRYPRGRITPNRARAVVSARERATARVRPNTAGGRLTRVRAGGTIRPNRAGGTLQPRGDEL